MNSEDTPRFLSVEGLSKRFKTPAGEVKVLEDVSFEVQRGEALAIVGPSGAGKTTLLHILGTIEKPSVGRVRFGGLDPFCLSRKALARFRNTRVGFVFQMHHLLPEFSALENVMMPAVIQGVPDKRARQRAMELLSEVGIAHRARHRPGELSGGEAQRVAIARAIVNAPDLVLADEPTGSLDEETGGRVFELLLGLNHDKNMTLVVVTHNHAFWGLMDRCLKLSQGRIREEV